MRAACIVILLSLASGAAFSQSLPAPAPDAPPLGVVHIPGGSRSADARAVSDWVWSSPEYCLTYTAANNSPVVRLVAASGMWIETIDIKLADQMNAICTAGRNYALYITWSGSTAYWTQLMMPAR